MNKKYYEIILTNGSVENSYTKFTFNKEQAIILAQADAIQNGMGYKLVSIKAVDNGEAHKRKIELRFEGYYCEFTRVANDDIEAEAILEEERLNGNGFLWRKDI